MNPKYIAQPVNSDSQLMRESQTLMTEVSQLFCYVMLLYVVMLCYLLCYMLLCYVMLCYAMLCHTMLCHVKLKACEMNISTIIAC